MLSPVSATPSAGTSSCCAATTFIWVTWLTRLLAGEASCEWAAWFRAQHEVWGRMPSDFDQSPWLMNHTAKLNQSTLP